MQIKTAFSASQLYGSGLAAVLICLIWFAFNRNDFILYLLFGLVILLMVWPAPFRYFAIVWFALGDALGYIVSKLLLSIIYLIVVIPVGLFVKNKIRRRMQLSVFKKDVSTAFRNREYTYKAIDFEKPF